MPDDDNYQMQVNVGGEVDPSLDKSLKAVEARVERLTKTVEGLDKMMARMGQTSQRSAKGTDAEAKSLTAASAAAQKMIGSAQKLDTAESKAAASAKHNAEITGKLADVTSRLTQMRERLGKVSEYYAKKEAAYQAQMSRAQRFDRFGQGMQNTGAFMQGAGVTMGAAGAGMLMRVMPDAGNYMDFAKSSAKFKARMNPEDRGRQGEFEEMARSEGARSGFGGTETMRALSELIAAGFTPDDLKKSLPDIIDLAKGADMSISQTADLATNIMAPFKLGVKDTKAFGNVLSRIAVDTEADVSELAAGMQYAAADAANLGMSLEQTAAVMGTLRGGGRIGSQMGTDLRNMLDGIYTGAGKETLEGQLGVMTTDAQGNARTDFLNIVKEMDAAMREQQMTSSEQMAMLDKMFGVQGATAMKILLGDQKTTDANGVEKMIKGYEKAAELQKRAVDARGGNLASEQAAIMSDHPEMAVVQFKEAWNNMMAVVMKESLPVFTDLLTKVTGLVQTMTAWSKEHPSLVKWIGVGTASLAGFLVVAGTAVTVLGTLVGAVGNLVKLRGLFSLIKAEGIKDGLISIEEGIGSSMANAGKKGAGRFAGNAAKFLRVGGAVVTAAIVGWEIGSAIEEQFKVSEKISSLIFDPIMEKMAKVSTMTQALMDSSKTLSATVGKQSDAAKEAARVQQLQMEYDKLKAMEGESLRRIAEAQAEADKMNAWYNPISSYLYGDATNGDLQMAKQEELQRQQAMRNLQNQMATGSAGTYQHGPGYGDARKKMMDSVSRVAAAQANVDKANAWYNPITRWMSGDEYDAELAAAKEEQLGIRAKMDSAMKSQAQVTLSKSAASSASSNVTVAPQVVINNNGVGLDEVAGLNQRQIDDSLRDWGNMTADAWRATIDDGAEFHGH